MKRIPISLIIDDGSPVNLYHFHQLKINHKLLIPYEFTKEFGKCCERNGIKGKFSVVPIPAGLGRIDRKVTQVPTKNLHEFLDVVCKQIAPNFSITPEILTHYLAYDIKKGNSRHVCEDVYFSNLSAAEVAEYVGLALEILCNVGLRPSGVSSPWVTGIDNENNYAAGIGIAFRKIMKVQKCFYFLHCLDNVTKPMVMCDSKETGKVVTIPANTEDPFWNTQFPATRKQAETTVQKKVDELLSADGRSGILRDLFEKELPVTLITHWQSLFSDGRAIGLAGLEVLAQRINHIFGNQVEWLTLEKLAARY